MTYVTRYVAALNADQRFLLTAEADGWGSYSISPNYSNLPLEQEAVWCMFEQTLTLESGEGHIATRVLAFDLTLAQAVQALNESAH